MNLRPKIVDQIPLQLKEKNKDFNSIIITDRIIIKAVDIDVSILAEAHKFIVDKHLEQEAKVIMDEIEEEKGKK